MRAVVKKWGNSASVRIPAAVMQAVQLQLNDAVDVREEAVRVKEYDLNEMLKRIKPENLHQEVEFGRPIGKEAW